jgi:hypothetical protein
MENLRNLYSSENIIKMMKSRAMRWAGYVAHKEMINAYGILVRRSEGKLRLRRPK